MKHNDIALKLEALDCKLGSLENLISSLESNQSGIKALDDGKSDSSHIALTEFLNRTPDRIDGTINCVQSIIDRLDSIVSNDPKEVRREN
jgi:prefoldin subunit 5